MLTSILHEGLERVLFVVWIGLLLPGLDCLRKGRLVVKIFEESRPLR